MISRKKPKWLSLSHVIYGYIFGPTVCFNNTLEILSRTCFLPEWNVLSSKKKSLHTFVLNYRYKQLQCCQARYYRLSSKFLKKCQKFDFYIFKVISYFLHENIEFAAPSQDARGENRIIDGRWPAKLINHIGTYFTN